MSEIIVGALQMCSGTNVQSNIDTFERLTREAASKGARYIQSPEMTGMLQSNRKDLFAHVKKQNDDDLVKKASALSLELNVTIHIGSTAILRDDGKIANRAFLFGSDGNLIATYDKIHMFDVDLDNGESWRESSTYTPGETCVTAHLPEFSLGMAICYDLRFPALFCAQAQNGAQILTAPAAFTKQTGQAHWHALLRARAIENGTFVISAAQGGTHEDGRQTYGHSLIIDPWGAIIGELNHDEPAVLTAKIDLQLSSTAHKKIPNLKNIRPFVVRNYPQTKDSQ